MEASAAEIVTQLFKERAQRDTFGVYVEHHFALAPEDLFGQ